MTDKGWSISTKYILIYGAHLVAQECCRDLVYNGLGEKILGFAVTDMKDNCDEVCGKKVKSITEYAQVANDTTVIIAMPRKYHPDVEKTARRYGFTVFICVSLEEMSEIKAKRMLSENDIGGRLPFEIKMSEQDISWLDGVAQGNKGRIQFKYPTLYYMEDEQLVNCSQDVYEKYAESLEGIVPLDALHSCGSKTIKGEEIAQLISIYMAFGEKEADYISRESLEPWISPLQVGCKFSNTRWGNLFDDEGNDNMSAFNSLLAEMTGSYWIWKYAGNTNYKGLCHYRRHFKLNPTDICRIQENDIDVMITTPRYAPGGIRKMFEAETPVKEPVFEAVFRAMSEIAKNDKDKFADYLNGFFYCPNNMVVAKREIFDDYCEWIFPILCSMMENDKRTGYGHETDRHIAYTAELLTSYYFLDKRDRFKVAYTDYVFLEKK